MEPHNFLKSLLNQVICSGPLLLSPFNESCSQNSSFCSAPRLPLAVGTFKCRGDDVKQAVLWALQSGYRHIGTIHPFLSTTGDQTASRRVVLHHLPSSQREENTDPALLTVLREWSWQTPRPSTGTRLTLERAYERQVCLVRTSSSRPRHRPRSMGEREKGKKGHVYINSLLISAVDGWKGTERVMSFCSKWM